MKISKKTVRQKEAEGEALQAFIMECEKRNILTKEILKNLSNKKLIFTNATVDANLNQAFSKFIQKGISNGEAFDSVVFCQNNFTDEIFSQILDPLSMPDSKTKSLVSVKNTIGPKSLKSILKIIQPQKQIFKEGFSNLQELVLNDSKLLQQKMMPQLISMLTVHCKNSLKVLGLAN